MKKERLAMHVDIWIKDKPPPMRNGSTKAVNKKYRRICIRRWIFLSIVRMRNKVIDGVLTLPQPFLALLLYLPHLNFQGSCCRGRSTCNCSCYSSTRIHEADDAHSSALEGYCSGTKDLSFATESFISARIVTKE